MNLNKLEIGNIIIAKKAILGIIFCFFLFGVLCGVYIAMIEDNPTSNMGLLIFVFYIPVVFVLYKPIKKGVLRRK